MRSIYMLAGLLMTALGIAGAFLPLLPTTPFLLVAVWCFSRSSPRLEQWLLNHQTLGPPLTNWRREGAISARTKVIAICLIVASYGFFWYRTQPSLLLAGVVGLILSASATFILTRPLPKRG
ncbi:YbaN family protein [Shinella sp. BYT-45]|uniref:YbaN family protein n=1 Tax=Shinella sp. BYT-45 TaxID=3377377 RepID=UPI00397EF758